MKIRVVKEGGGGFRYYRLGPSMIVEDEWGHDDYSLEIENLPDAPPEVLEKQQAKAERPSKTSRKYGKGKDTPPTLFDMGGR